MTSNVSALIKQIDDDLRTLLDKRFDLQFELDFVNDTINEKKMLRTYYKFYDDDIFVLDNLSKPKIERATRTRSQSPSSRTNNKKKYRLQYNQA